MGTPAAVGLTSFSVTCAMLYHGVLYSVLTLSSTILWLDLDVDVTCMTSRNLSSHSPLRHARYIIGNPLLPSARDVIYRRPFLRSLRALHWIETGLYAVNRPILGAEKLRIKSSFCLL